MTERIGTFAAGTALEPLADLVLEAAAVVAALVWTLVGLLLTCLRALASATEPRPRRPAKAARVVIEADDEGEGRRLGEAA